MAPPQVPERILPTDEPQRTLRVATYNIHKGVQSVGPAKRLEIHNLQQAIQQLDADIVCLQEVRKMNRQGERRFANWPQQGQADFLKPQGYHALYMTNAVTKHGEHGNALLSRFEVVRHKHEDMSDHRFEQRGLLHGEVNLQGKPVHVIVVHLGLIAASRVRQIRQLQEFIDREIGWNEPLLVAGDFNDWGKQLVPIMAECGLHSECQSAAHFTYPARLPLAQLDHVYSRGLHRVRQFVPQLDSAVRNTGIRSWSRLSDHLPLVAEFELDR